jgi:hypothetical protein
VAPQDGVISSTPKSIPLLRCRIRLEQALDDDENLLQKIAYPERRLEFSICLYTRRSEIEAAVSYHRGFSGAEGCRMGEVSEWIATSFNVCILVYVEKWAHARKNRVLIRIPLLYKIGEAQKAGQRRGEAPVRSDCRAMDIREVPCCANTVFLWIWLPWRPECMQFKFYYPPHP